jgi:hypothetical protein
MAKKPFVNENIPFSPENIKTGTVPPIFVEFSIGVLENYNE